MSLFKSRKQTEFCPDCGGELHIKQGKKGLFLGCSNYPACDYLKPLQQTSHIIRTLDEICPECGDFLQLKQGHFGIFIGCANYPACDFVVHREQENEAENCPCPECQKGQLVARQGRAGKTFYACSRYPDCKFTLASQPQAVGCPECHYPIAVRKKGRGTSRLQCANKSCQHIFDEPTPETEEKDQREPT